MSQTPENIQDEVDEAFENLNDDGSDTGGTSSDGLQNAVDDIVGGAQDVADDVTDAVDDAREKAQRGGSGSGEGSESSGSASGGDTGGASSEGLQNAVDDIVGGAQDVADDVTDAVNDAREKAQPDNSAPSQSGGAASTITPAEQQNIDSAVAQVNDRVRQEQQGVEAGSGALAEQASTFEQRVAVQEGLAAEDIAIRREGDRLTAEATATGVQTLQRRARASARREAPFRMAADVATDVAGDLASVSSNRNQMAATAGVTLAEQAGDLLTGGDEPQRSQSFERAQRNARQVARRAEETAVAPNVNISDLPAGLRGSVQAVQQSQERGVAQSAAQPRRPQDFGDRFVPDYIEDPVNEARAQAQQTAQQTLDTTGGFSMPVGGIGPGGNVRVAGVGGEPTAAARGIGDITTAPFDSAVAGIEAAETGTYVTGGTGLAGGSPAETQRRVGQVADEGAFFAGRAAEAAQENPVRFGAAIVGESLIAGGVAGRLGSGRTSITSSIDETLRTGRRAGRLAGPQGYVSGRLGRAADTLGEARARSPSIEVTRDPDAGLIDYQGLVTRSGDSRLPSLDDIRNLPERGRVARDRAGRGAGDLATDISYTLGEARRRAGEALTPTPRRGTGDFAVDADITSARQGDGGISQQAATTAASLDLAGQRAVGALGSARDRAARAITPEPRRGSGDFAVDAGVTEGTPLADRIGRFREQAGYALLGAAGSGELGAQRLAAAAGRTRNRVAGALTPEPRRGTGDFAVDGSIGGGGLSGLFDVDRPTGGAVLGGLGSARLGVGGLRDAAGRARSRAASALTPEPRRGSGEFAVDAGVTEGTPLADRIGRFREQAGYALLGAAGSGELAAARLRSGLASGFSAGDGPSVLDTTIRVRPGRPPRQSRTLSSRLFETGEAEGAELPGFDADGPVRVDVDTGDGGTRTTTLGETDSGGQQTVMQLDTRRTGTGTDVNARSDTLDTSGRRPMIGPATAPTIDPATATTPAAGVGTPTGIAGTGASVGFGAGLGVGELLGTGGVTTPEFDIAQRTDLRVDEETRLRNDSDSRGSDRVGVDRRIDSRLEQELEERQRQEARTRRDTGTRLRFELPDAPDSESRSPGGRDRAPGGRTDGDDAPLLAGFAFETLADIQAGGVADESAITASQAELSGAVESGYFAGELPTDAILEGGGDGGFFDFGGGR